MVNTPHMYNPARLPEQDTGLDQVLGDVESLAATGHSKRQLPRARLVRLGVVRFAKQDVLQFTGPAAVKNQNGAQLSLYGGRKFIFTCSPYPGCTQK